MKRTLTTLLFLLVLSIIVMAQGPSVRVRIGNGTPQEVCIDSLLKGFNHSAVHTGFLKEKGFEFVNFDAINGDISNEYLIDIYSLNEVLRSLSTMTIADTLTWSYPSIKDTATNSIPVHIALYEYNTLSEEAYQRGRIVLDGSSLRPAPGANPDSLYKRKELIAIAPECLSTKTGNVSYSFSLTDNTNLDYTQLYFDADDGLGYRQISTSAPVSVIYSVPGVKQLKIKAATANKELISRSYVVVEEVTINPSPTGDADLYVIEHFEGTYYDEEVTACLSYKPASAFAPSQRPIIVVEGFDPYLILGLEINGLGGNSQVDSLGFTKSSDSWLEELSNYDIYYVDWLNCEADIRANAQLLKDIITYINSFKQQTGAADDNIVIAESMGGLITQIALREMELSEQPHDVGDVFFFDVPFLGANLPMGAIWGYQSLWTYFLQTLMPSNVVSRQKQIIDSYLYSKAVQQMSINYIDANCNLSPSVHNSFLSYLNTLGLPQGDSGKGIYNYSVSNGGDCSPYRSQVASNQGHLLYAYGNLRLEGIGGFVISLFDTEHLLGSSLVLIGGDFASVILSLAPGLSSLNAQFIINPNNGSTSPLSLLTIQYVNRIFGFIEVTREFVHDERPAPAASKPIDNYNGSLYEIPIGGLKTGGQDSLKNVYSVFSEASLVDKIVFIPSYSSLRYPQGADTPRRNYRTDPIGRRSAFDGYHLADAAEEHVQNFPVAWMNSMIEDVYIDCPDTLETNDILTLHGYYGQPLWESISNVLYIDETGEVKGIYREDDVELCAYYLTNGTYVRRKKRVHLKATGLAPIYLEPSLDAETGWLNLTLHSPDSSLDARLQTYEVQRTWYSKRDTESLTQNPKNPIVFSISNFESMGIRYFFQVAALVRDTSVNRPQEFVSHTIWNNQRLSLKKPTAIVFDDDNVYMEVRDSINLVPISIGDSLVVSYDPSLPAHYSDYRVTDTMGLILDSGETFYASRENDEWGFPIFSSDAVLEELESMFLEIGEDDIGMLRVEIYYSDGEGMAPVQTYHIPILRMDQTNNL